jgi:murein DD-endopeptidase MepM/ murein hydrolase activator NlpD
MSSTSPIDPVVGAASAGAGAPGAEPSPDQLRVLAAQFESLLLGQMLKTMRSSMSGDDEDSDSGFAPGPLGDALFAELSVALGRAGGLGLGDSLVQPLMRQSGIEGELAAGRAVSANEPPAAAGVSRAARITSGYGWRRDPVDGSLAFHKGTDVAMPVGQHVPAARGGTVSFAGELPGYGMTILLDHGSGIATRYAHLSELAVQAGETVAEGQIIARSGASGRATGPHLHFEVLEHGQPVNPGSWLLSTEF